MGKLRQRLLLSWRREGPPISYSGPFIFPMKTPEPGSRVPRQGSLSVWTETQGVAAGSPGQGAPSCYNKPEGYPPPPRLLVGEAGLSPPAPTHVPEKGSFLAPGLFSLPGGSSGDRAGKKAAKGDRETWKRGPSGCLTGAWAQSGVLSRRAAWI